MSRWTVVDGGYRMRSARWYLDGLMQWRSEEERRSGGREEEGGVAAWTAMAQQPDTRRPTRNESRPGPLTGKGKRLKGGFPGACSR
jgi:hypothetical protein